MGPGAWRSGAGSAILDPVHRVALVSMVLAASACATRSRHHDDWCGTDRAALHAAGDLHAACALGDVEACEKSGEACGGDHLFARFACDPRYARPWRPSPGDDAR